MFCGILPAQPQPVGSEYCPVDIGLTWTYSFFSKKENRQKPDINVFIKRTGKYGGELYTIYEVPSRGMRFFVAAKEDGIYMRAGQADIPVLSFINVSMDFSPPPIIFKFPVKNNDTWHCEARTGVRALGLINIEQKAWADFTVTGPEIIDVSGNTMSVYRIHMTISRSFNDDKPMTADCYMAEGIGLVKSETKNSILTLKP